MNRSSNLINALFIFVLAGFIGFEVIRRVSPLLHTPLMSLTNALDAIAVVGAIVLVGERKRNFAAVLGVIAIVATARHGIWAGEVGMVLAIAGTLLHHGIVDYKWIIIALVLGSGIGIPLGRVKMTAVPQRTALSHAFGALCVTLVGTAEFYLRTPDVPKFMMSVLSMEVILGGLTFTGSLMAAGKLQEILPQRPITYKGQNIVNLGLLGIAIAVAAYLVMHPEAKQFFPLLVGIPLIFGVFMVIPI